MTIHLSNSRDLVLLNLVGLSLFRLIVKARSRSKGLATTLLTNDRHVGNSETIIEYEAAWTGDFPERENDMPAVDGVRSLPSGAFR